MRQRRIGSQAAAGLRRFGVLGAACLAGAAASGGHAIEAVETDGATALEVVAYRLLQGEQGESRPEALPDERAGSQYEPAGRGSLPLTLWSHMGRTRSDDPTEWRRFEVDGRVDAAFLGTDFQRSAEMMLGLLGSYGGGMDYKRRKQSGVADTEAAHAAPHAHWLDEGLYAWVYASGGRGEAELRAADGSGTVKTDIDMRMASGGIRKEIDERWALRADAFAMKIESEARAPVLRTGARAERVRVMLEGREHWSEEEADEQLTVRYAIGARLDRGDAASGAGTEIQGNVEYRNEEVGLSFKGGGWYLLTHDQSDYEEWGASLELELDPGEPGTGPRLSVAPAWGTAPDGALALWGSSAAELSDGWLPEQRLDISLGYGLRRARGDLLTLFGGYSYDGWGDLYQGGVYWETDENALMTWTLEHSRRPEKRPETAVKFQFEMRY